MLKEYVCVYTPTKEGVYLCHMLSFQLWLFPLVIIIPRISGAFYLGEQASYRLWIMHLLAIRLNRLEALLIGCAANSHIRDGISTLLKAHTNAVILHDMADSSVRDTHSEIERSK